MDTNLYALLAAQHTLDEQQKQQSFQLAALSDFLTNVSDSVPGAFHDPVVAATMSACWNQITAMSGKQIDAAVTNSTMSHIKGGIPLDSPLDQSLGSPASTRDFQESPLQDYDFDFSSNADAPLFPDHGTQQSSHNDNLLSGLPLFGNELALSQSALSAKSNPASQMSANVAMQPIGDFSFDASTQAPISFDVEDVIATALPDLLARPTSPSEPAGMHTSYDKSQDGAYINHFSEASASFVRECARLSSTHGTDFLQRALRSAGWGVSDELAASIVSSVESRSPSPSLGASQASDPSFSPRASISPMALPAATDAISRKIRSSIQSSPRESLSGVNHREAKRFICPDCNKHFDRAFNLRTHSLTHVKPDDREKPFTCPWSACSKPFSRKYDAERHYKTIHARRGDIASPEQIATALSGSTGLSSPSASSSFSTEIDSANG